ncbi:MAG TPA: HEPN domain-containing protein [Candidatus Tripitaka sp. YC43]
MDEGLEKQAAEWFERGRHDIEMAQLLYDERGYTDTIAFLIQQAVEKYLKGFLVLKSIPPRKTHNLDFLLKGVIEFDKDFGEFIDLCRKATKYYIEERYPPSPTPQYSYEEIEADLAKAWELIRKIREKCKIKNT